VTIVAAADGSALGNPGPAGWAWYVDEGCWASGGWPRGTNNMGELMAVLDLLQQTAGVGDDLLVYCDSTYVINTVTQWMAGWKRRGWRKKDGKPVLNVELIRALDEAMSGRQVRFEWVKGHAGHPLNEAADKLAVAASTAFRDGLQPDPGPGFAGGSANHPDVKPGQTDAEEDLFSVGESEPESDVEQVVALERALLGDGRRADPAAVEALLDPGWTGVDVSGRAQERADLLAATQLSGPTDLEVLAVEPLAADVLLLRSRCWSGTVPALRSSVWVRRGGRWRQRFTQGTAEA
jgi:ribonuclease HI